MSRVTLQDPRWRQRIYVSGTYTGTVASALEQAIEARATGSGVVAAWRDLCGQVWSVLDAEDHPRVEAIARDLLESAISAVYHAADRGDARRLLYAAMVARGAD